MDKKIRMNLIFWFNIYLFSFLFYYKNFHISKDLIITNTITCDDGDFIKFEMSDDGKNMTLGEHFSPKNLVESS